MAQKDYSLDGNVSFNDGRTEDLKDFVERRNGMVKEFFENRGFQVQLKGNPENPAIVLNNGIWLSAWVHNFNLIFSDIPNHGVRVEEIKLNFQNVKNYPVSNLVKLITDYEHILSWRIKLKDHNLWLAGYEHADRDNSRLQDHNKLYPVFGKIKLHVWKTPESATEILEKIKDDYNVTLDQYKLKF